MRDRMSVPSILANRPGARGRAAGLLVVLGAALLLPACNGPTVQHAPPSVGQYAVSLQLDPPTLQRDNKATFSYTFTDQQTGKPAVNLPLVHDAVVHTTLVSQDLTTFSTGKDVVPVNGSYPVNLRFGSPSAYRLYAEFTSGYSPTQTLIYTHSVAFGPNPPSLEEPAPLVESPTPRSKSFFGVVVSLDTGTAGLTAGQPATFHYTLTTVRNSRPITDVAPLDGAGGQLYIVSADGETFAHLYTQVLGANVPNGQYDPTSGGGAGAQTGNSVSLGPGGQAVGTPVTMNAPAGGLAGLGPDFSFQYTFEKPGLYKTWLQFLWQGVPVTADYVVRVGP